MQNYLKELSHGLAVWTHTTKNDSSNTDDNVKHTNVNESLSFKRKRDEGVSSKNITTFPSIISMVTSPLNALLSLSPNFLSNSSTNDKSNTNINDNITTSSSKIKESLSDDFLPFDDNSNDVKPPVTKKKESSSNDSSLSNDSNDSNNEKPPAKKSASSAKIPTAKKKKSSSDDSSLSDNSNDFINKKPYIAKKRKIREVSFII